MSASETALTLRASDIQEIGPFNDGLLAFLQSSGLPTSDVLTPTEQRRRVINNLSDALSKLDSSQKARSLYVSKFTAAVAAGLFDAALNYLWDETIQELRHRVMQYDVSYFFDVAVKSANKRSNLKGASDLDKITDDELLQGAREIGLISDVGFKQLDSIRYMRNWASAAHPNQNDLTGLQLIAWLETCINEVVALPVNTIVAHIARLLTNVRSSEMNAAEASQAAAFFGELDRDRAGSLASGLFGIYVDKDSPEHARQNVRHLLPRLWVMLGEDVRRSFGVKYGQYAANGETGEAERARALLTLVDAASYVPEALRAAEVQDAIQNLLAAHRAPMKNFHLEPTFARQLDTAVGGKGTVPESIEAEYVRAIVEVYLTNGHGTAYYAEPIYQKLIAQFTPRQASRALLSFTDPSISSKLDRSLPKKKFDALLELVEAKLISPVAKDLLVEVRAFAGPADKMHTDAGLRPLISAVRQLLAI
jgi:hypothetical protein